MTIPFHRAIPSFLAAPFMACASPAMAAPVNIVHENIKAKGTMVLPVLDVSVPAVGQTQFVIDTRKMSLGKKMAMGSARRAAVIFGDNVDPQTARCPFIDLRARQYTIREQTTRATYRVETVLSAQEAEAANQAGCLITTPPERSKIQFLPKH